MWLLLLLTLSADGGTSDAGVVDAGPPPSPYVWIATDGGFFTDDGVTDILTMRVGETATITLGRPIVLMQCDDELLKLNADTDSLLLTAKRAGKTRCGFWFESRAYPHRYFDVTVTR
ncbi:MAG: hypothetical protein ACO1OB_01445 [Archangium sp.]